MMRTAAARSNAWLRSLAVVTLLGVTSAACVSGGEDPLELGLKRIALDLAFKDEDLAPPPPEPKVITRIIEVDQDVYESLPQQSVRSIPRIRPPERQEFECPEAEGNAIVEDTAFHELKVPPAEGSYPRHNEGEIKATIGADAGGGAPAISFDLPYPRKSVWEIRNLREVRSSGKVRPEDEAEIRSSTPETVRDHNTVFPLHVRFDLVKKIGFGFTQTVETTSYMYEGPLDEPLLATELFLVRRETVRGDGEPEIFEPTPPIKVLDLNAVQDEQQPASAGVDREREKGMVVQYQIADREYVDVCGEYYDTFVVMLKETMVDLSTNPPQTTGTDEGDFIKWNVVFDHPNSGMLIVQEEGHYMRRTSYETTVNGQPATVPMEVRYDYVSTIDDARNVPLPLEAEDQ